MARPAEKCSGTFRRRRHDQSPARHRFQYRKTEAFRMGRRNENVEGGVKLGGVVDPIEPQESVLEVEHFNEAFELAAERLVEGMVPPRNDEATIREIFRDLMCR